jgi:hypothetical protein
MANAVVANAVVANAVVANAVVANAVAANVANAASPMLAQPAAIQIVSTPSVELNKTFIHTLTNYGFDCLPSEMVTKIFKDARVFSHFIEPWLAANYPIVHVTGCKKFDHVDAHDATIQYDEKTFTLGGCKLMPSNMIGQGRKFDPEVFAEKAKKLIYIIVSNIAFPLIKVRFMRGSDLIVTYPKGFIPLKDLDKFFN